jgi:tetratricopeptide (TPR) repeat protein
MHLQAIFAASLLRLRATALLFLPLAGAGRANQDTPMGRLESAANLENAGDWPAAEKLLLSTRKEFPAEMSDPKFAATFYSLLGFAYRLQDRQGEAERCFRQALQTYQATADRSPVVLARFLYNLAQGYIETGRFAEAERLNITSVQRQLEASAPEAPENVRMLATPSEHASTRPAAKPRRSGTTSARSKLPSGRYPRTTREFRRR